MRTRRPVLEDPTMLILAILVFGMFIGWLAQMIVSPGRRPDWPRDLVAGLVGSFVGGTAISLLAGDGLQLRPSGIIGSLLGAIAVLFAWRAIAGEPTT
jgi:uncharacterized membrane protein YeaQ/YmgE (transglycosylase-associated protein family)